jgi:hypothetical protein
MYVIIGSRFVQLEDKFLLIALVIVRITLNVIMCLPLKLVLKYFNNVISTCCKNIVEVFESLITSF